jgi:hypothetical protein
LGIYTESATGVPVADVDVMQSWKQICALEAEDLKNESYGVELMHAVGATYVAKARCVHCNYARRFTGANQILARIGSTLHKENHSSVLGASSMVSRAHITLSLRRE